MAFNAAIAAAGANLSVQSTPMRERDRHPFPLSAHPSPGPSLQQTSSSSASTSFVNLPSTASPSPSIQASPQTITVEALLKQHALAPNPSSAALEQAVNDRNVLAAQNSQLWKLIEKQRAGYNQILKELERIRAERDGYKNKLGALNGGINGTSDKRQKLSSERGSRPSLDTSSTHSSSISSLSPITQVRQTLGRHNSDDTATPRNQQYPHLHSSRSYEPLHGRPNGNELQSNANYALTSNKSSTPPPAPPSSAPALVQSSSRTSRPSPSPLVVPPRAANLPTASSAVSNSPASSTSIKQPNSADPNTMTNNPAGNGISSSPNNRPLVYPRKSSLADSFSSVVTSGSSVSSSSTSATSSLNLHNLGGSQSSVQYTPLQQQDQFGASPPTTSPGYSTTPITYNVYPQRTSSSTIIAPPNPPPIITTPMTTVSPQPPPSQPQSLPQPQLLSATNDSRPEFLSRDSRISLPAEARQYIANMADSPVPSPRTETFSPKSKLSTSVFPPTANGATAIASESEFLDMEEEEDYEEDDDEDDDPGDVTAGAGDPAFESLQSGVPRQSSQEQRYTEDQHQGSQLAYQNVSSSRSSSSREDSDALVQGKRKDKSRVAAEEFPLPPPSNIHMQRPAAGAQDSQDYAQNSQAQLLQAQQQGLVQAPSPSKQTQAMIDQIRPSASSGGQFSHDSYPQMQENPYNGQQQNPQRTDSRTQQQDGQQPQAQAVPASFRALPLLSTDLPHTNITVSHSFVRPNDRGKEVLSFIVFVNPGHGKEGWKVEKMYSDVLGLDQRVRSSVGKGVGKKIGNLPEGKLWKDHAPAKVDQRKAVLENYLQTLIQLPVKNNDEVIAFFTSDIVREQKQPVMQAGHKEGYLTKRGKNFGGWKTRFFVLQGPVLEYYDCRGGAHLGSIAITGAQIARQHRTERPPTSDDEKEYRHAFLIVEAKKGPGGNHPRHVLCAESDEDRDSWVEMLVRYYTGTYSEDLVFNPSSGLTSAQSNSVAATILQQSGGIGQPRSSTSSNDMSSSSAARVRTPARGVSREDIAKGTAVPISQLPSDAANAKLFQSVPTSDDYMRSSSPSKSLVDPSPIDRQGPSAAGGFDSYKPVVDRGLGLPSSLPDSSPLSNAQGFQPDSNTTSQRANSELGHYPDLQDHRHGHGGQRNHRQHSPEHHRIREPQDGRKSFYPTLNTVAPSPTTAVPPDRAPSPEKLDANGKVKISSPMNGAPIPSGFKFGGKELSSADAAAAANERREKAKSRSFWGFGKANGDKSHPHVTYIPRAVFGVPLEEALEVAQMCNLPAIVFRSIQYLEAKKADQEEGIYRLSGSSAVIKGLKDRFNNEGDVDLLGSDEYWDPHAIAGLLKSFLRELPASILTRDLHLKFLAVIDFVDAQERIKELSYLIAALPLANYSLLRALTAHLILVVQNSNVNKMTMRNVGIVFSPTLGIPAGVFSLMLGEFNRVFNVDADNDTDETRENDGSDLLEQPSEPYRRNSRQYSDAAADQLLGLSGRTLSTPAEETQSDGDDFSIQDESGTEYTEGEATVESSSSASPVSGTTHRDLAFMVTPPETPNTPVAKSSKASNAAASRGLNVAVSTSDRGNRHSRMMGLPSSPRPTTVSPSRPQEALSSFSSQPAHTPE
ncbi:hypothetical protein B0H34DRAFT_704674 [Crassisporium funariophilum]|nr:hypothetical protein B0H34DRAFT_704674 [Crassisporium funariophilum]